MSSSGCLIPRLFFKVCSAFLNCSLLIVIFVASFIWDRSATPITKTFYEIVAGIRICIIYGCHYKPAVPIGKYNRPTTTNASNSAMLSREIANRIYNGIHYKHRILARARRSQFRSPFAFGVQGPVERISFRPGNDESLARRTRRSTEVWGGSVGVNRHGIILQSSKKSSVPSVRALFVPLRNRNSWPVPADTDTSSTVLSLPIMELIVFPALLADPRPLPAQL
jgi:hypothetical protein